MSATRCRHGNVLVTSSSVHTCWECVATEEPKRLAQLFEQAIDALRLLKAVRLVGGHTCMLIRHEGQRRCEACEVDDMVERVLHEAE